MDRLVDRCLTAAGGLADAADRAVRAVLHGPRWATRPVSAAFAAGLVAIALLAVAASLETPATGGPREMSAADVAALRGSSGRFGAIVSGGLATQYTEYFQDLDLDGAWDEGEPTIEWDYFLVDPVTHAGVTVRSQRSIEDVFTLAANGYVVEDPAYIRDRLDWFEDELTMGGLSLDRRRYIDTTMTGAGAPLDLAADLPRAGTPVAVSGARSTTYLPGCDGGDVDGYCPDAEAGTFDVVVFDPDSRRAVLVRTDESPALQAATFQGVLRRDAGGIVGALEGTGWAPSDLDFTVSPELVLVDGAVAPSGLPLLLLAALSLGLAVAIVLGAASGYVRFRPTPDRPVAVRSLATGVRLGTRVTGSLHGRTGDVHVREAPADVIRYATASGGDDGPDTPSVLIVQRDGRPDGVALRPRDATAIETGVVRSLRWTRPALRIAVDTGPLILTFDDAATRDRVAAEAIADATVTEEGAWTPGS